MAGNATITTGWLFCFSRLAQLKHGMEILQVELLEAVSMMVPGKWLPCPSCCPTRTQFLSGNFHEATDVTSHEGYACHTVSDHVLQAAQSANGLHGTAVHIQEENLGKKTAPQQDRHE